MYMYNISPFISEPSEKEGYFRNRFAEAIRD
jgi:hypothetical protein